jgi:hypothetical protein
MAWAGFAFVVLDQWSNDQLSNFIVCDVGERKGVFHQRCRSCLLKSEVGQSALGGVRIFNADEHVIDGQRHLFLRSRSERPLFRFAGELRGGFGNDDSWQHARRPNVDSAPQINRLVQ